MDTYLETERPALRRFAADDADLLRKAFTELGVRMVWAATMSVNPGSRNIMERRPWRTPVRGRG